MEEKENKKEKKVEEYANLNDKIQVFKKRQLPKMKPLDDYQITTTERIEKREYNKDGTVTIKYELKKTNVTRLVNETAKILKAEVALEKLNELKNSLN